ncbi:MAG: hypothetical protein ACXIVE_04835 [Salinarimonas sp.]
MPDLKRIIVVDTGDRGPDAAISADLAELGIMSVTLSLEAASEVISTLPEPDAVFLHLPDGAGPAIRADFAAFAGELEASNPALPVITIDGAADQMAGSHLSFFKGQIGSASSEKPPRI